MEISEIIKGKYQDIIRTKIEGIIKNIQEYKSIPRECNLSEQEIFMLKDMLIEAGLEEGKDFIHYAQYGHYDEGDYVGISIAVNDIVINFDKGARFPNISTDLSDALEGIPQDEIEDGTEDRIEDGIKPLDLKKIGIELEHEGSLFEKVKVIREREEEEKRQEEKRKEIKLREDLETVIINIKKFKKVPEDIKINGFDFQSLLRKAGLKRDRDFIDIGDVSGFSSTIKIDDLFVTFDETIEIQTEAEWREKNTKMWQWKCAPGNDRFREPTLVDLDLDKLGIEIENTRNIRESFEESLLRDDVVEYYLSKTPEELEAELGPEVARMVGFEQKNSHHCYDLWEHTLRTVEGISPEGLTPEEFKKLRVAAFFHDIGKPDVSKFNEKTGQQVFYGHAVHSVEVAKPVLEQLGYSSDEIEQLSFYIGHHDDFISYKSKTAPWMKNHEFMRGIDSDTVSEKIIENQYDFKAMGYDEDQIRYICYALGHDGQEPTFATKDGPININVDMAEVQAKIDSGKYDASYIPSEADYKLLLELCKADAGAQSEVAMQQGRVVGSKKEKLENMNNIQNSIPEAFKSVVEKVTGYSFEQFIKDSVPQAYGEKRPPLICKDGTEYSIQASSFHACLPKEDGLEAYDEFEVYVMSDVEDFAEFINYDGVAGNVPKEVIEGIIKSHGGLDKKVMRERVQAQKDVFKPKDEAYEKWLEEASNGNPFVAQMLRYATRRVEVRGQDEQAKKLEEQYGEQLPKDQHTVDDNE